MSRIYAVVSITYQYNDEFYWTDGCNQQEAYKLEQVFSKKEKADAVCLQKNREAFIERFGEYGDLGEWVGGCNTANERLFKDIDEKADKALWKTLEVCGVAVGDLKPRRNKVSNRSSDVYDTAYLLTKRLQDAYQEKKLSDELLDQIRHAMGLDFYEVVEAAVED